MENISEVVDHPMEEYAQTLKQQFKMVHNQPKAIDSLREMVAELLKTSQKKKLIAARTSSRGRCMMTKTPLIVLSLVNPPVRTLPPTHKKNLMTR